MREHEQSVDAPAKQNKPTMEVWLVDGQGQLGERITPEQADRWIDAGFIKFYGRDGSSILYETITNQ